MTHLEQEERKMTAKLKHLAIVSDSYALLGRFYQSLFGMQSFPNARPDSAVAVTDGYVGLNINPRRPGRQGGLDHFGFEVEDVDEIFARAERYPNVHYIRRPSNRPFAGISMHDPEGNVFDLSQRGMSNRADVYAADVQRPAQGRRVDHLVLRALDPSLVARFYADLFDLRETAHEAGEDRVCLTDGTVALIIAPWRIADFIGTGIERPALDHIGFAVDDLEEFERDAAALSARNAHLAPRALTGPEGEARLTLLRGCGLAHRQLSDPDSVLLDVREQRPAA